MLARYHPKLGQVLYGWQKPADFEDPYMREPALVYGAYTDPEKLLKEIAARPKDPVAGRNRMSILRTLAMPDAEFWEWAAKDYHVSLLPNSLSNEMDE